jgi:mannose-6-phosphate isomerase-like protein (cupin superfamily)
MRYKEPQDGVVPDQYSYKLDVAQRAHALPSAFHFPPSTPPYLLPNMIFSNLTNTTAHADSGEIQITFDAVDATTANSTQDAKVIYPSAENNYRVSIAIVPMGSKFHPGAHWHEDYDEVMRVVKGRAKIRLGSVTKVYGPEDGEILIKRGVVHDLWRADVDANEGEKDEGDLVMEERSEPGTFPHFHTSSSYFLSALMMERSGRLQRALLPARILHPGRQRLVWLEIACTDAASAHVHGQLHGVCTGPGRVVCYALSI